MKIFDVQNFSAAALFPSIAMGRQFDEFYFCRVKQSGVDKSFRLTQFPMDSCALSRTILEQCWTAVETLKARSFGGIVFDRDCKRKESRGGVDFVVLCRTMSHLLRAGHSGL